MLIDASCRVVQVTGAFFGSDFVTVSKTEDYNWAVLKPDIFAAIMDHFASGEPLFTDASAAASDTAINDDDTEVPIRSWSSTLIQTKSTAVMQGHVANICRSRPPHRLPVGTHLPDNARHRPTSRIIYS
jgi:hypothetical protein